MVKQRLITFVVLENPVIRSRRATVNQHFEILMGSVKNQSRVFRPIIVFENTTNPHLVRYITTYYIVASFVQWRIARYDWNILNDIREGRLANYLLRPMSYPATIFWYEAGGRSWSTLLTLPVYVLVIVLLRNDFALPPDGLTWVLTFIAFLIAYLLSFFLTASIGLIVVWQNQPDAFSYLYDTLSRWLGGTMIPLTLMPFGLGIWFQWLPFAYIYNLPVRIFLGLPPDQILEGFAIQLAWLLVMILFFRWLWRKALLRYEGFEG